MKCPKCRRDLDTAEFYAGSSTMCKGCMTFQNLSYNAKKEGHTLSLSKSDFLSWYGRAKDRHCTYCGISESSFTNLKRKNPRGYHVQCLGVDRSDSAKGYDKDNIRLACFICNRVKSDIFTPKEMEVVGQGISRIWDDRKLT